ncbi:MAG: cellulase family glycosylhydrolase [bacterium]
MNLNKLILALVLAAVNSQWFIATSATSSPKTNQFLTFFHAEGRDIVADATGEKWFFRGVNLNGLEFGSFSDSVNYPGELNKDYFAPDLSDVTETAFNAIRIPFEWARLAPGWQPNQPLPDTLNQTYRAILDTLIQQARSAQKYLILDMHDFLIYWSGAGSKVCVDSSEPHQRLLARTWQLLAKRYRDEPAIFAYDIQNEPVRQEPDEICSSCNWHEIAQTVVDAIREVDQNHLILIEGANFSLSSDWLVENPQPFVTDRIEPARIVYSPHVFFDFNNDSRYDQAGEEMGPRIEQWVYYVRDRLLPVLDWSKQFNVPIFLGETNVICTKVWADVLEFAFREYFDPFYFSTLAWNYSDPAYCPQPTCPLNLKACEAQHQLHVFKNHPAFNYLEMSDLIEYFPQDSKIFDDIRVNPWHVGVGSFGEVQIDFATTTPLQSGRAAVAVLFQKPNFAGVKFIHEHGLNTEHYNFLSFWIYLTGDGQQNFKLFTTAPLSDCDGGTAPVYPATFAAQVELKDFLPDSTTGKWQRVVIPLSNNLVNPENSIINSMTFQNINLSQDVFYLDNIVLTSDTALTSVITSPFETPTLFTLDQNFPNPFNPSTTIRFKLTASTHVTLKIFNLLGEEIVTLIDSFMQNGEHDFVWHPQNLASGLYFYKMQTGTQSQTHKLIFFR